MTDGDLDELPEALRRRQLDVALMYTDELTPDFGIVPLRTIAPHVVVAEDHLLVQAGRTSVSLHELVDEPAAFLSLSHSFNRYISYFRALNITPNIKYTSSSYEAIPPTLPPGSDIRCCTTNTWRSGRTAAGNWSRCGSRTMSWHRACAR